MKHTILLVIGLTFLWQLTAQAEESKIKFSGDFRYRHELISEEKAAGDNAVRVPDRIRHRMRLRVGMQAQVNPQMDIVTRLASGVGEPVSTNQDLGGGFSQKSVWIDRAFLDYHPCGQFDAKAGKFAVPFESTDLVWDGDLNLEGIAAMSSIKKDKMELFLRAGGFWAAERKSSDGPDQGLFGAQAGGRAGSDPLSGMLGLAYYDYGNVKNGPTIYGPKGFGNSIYMDTGRTLYRSDFNLINAVGELKSKQKPVDITLNGDFVLNTAAQNDSTTGEKHDTGWLAGIAFQFKKIPLGWTVAYNYRDLQADAAIGALVDSDSGGGSTNINGHKFSLSCMPLSKVKLGVTYFRDTLDPDGAKLAYNRLMIDVEAKY